MKWNRSGRSFEIGRSFFFLSNGFSGFRREIFCNKRLHKAFNYAQISIRMRLKLWFRVALKERAWMCYGGQAMFYATWLLIVTGLMPRWGVWYSSSVPHRMRTEALWRGWLELSKNPMDLDHDLTWSQQGVHQVWGLGVSLWRLPFEATAKLLGLEDFPDRIAFGLFAGLVAFIALWGVDNCLAV